MSRSYFLGESEEAKITPHCGYEIRRSTIAAQAAIDITRLKEFALSEIPHDWVLRDLLLSEKTLLSKWEFIAKVDLWLKLARRKHL